MMLKHRILQVYWPRILNHRKLVMAACLYTLKILFNDFLSLNSCSIFKFLFDNTYTTTIICLPVWLTRLILARKGTLPLHVCISSIVHTGLFFIIYLFFRLFFKLLNEKCNRICVLVFLERNFKRCNEKPEAPITTSASLPASVPV